MNNRAMWRATALAVMTAASAATAETPPPRPFVCGTCLDGPTHLHAPPSKMAIATAGTCDDGSVIDVLVLYTHAARDHAGGTAAMETLIDVMIEYNNVAFTGSAINTTFNLVYTRLLGPEVEFVSITELTDPADGVVDEAHVLRDAYGADQVALILPGFFGVANGLTDLEPASEATGFSISGLDAAPYVLSHEIGHNLGCYHPVGAGGGCPPEGGLLFPFSNAHVYTGDSGTVWTSVMAGSNLQRFSNPDVSFDGHPTGIAPGPGEIGADNAQTINIAAPVVANWRCNDGICEGLDLPGDAVDCDDDGVPDACAPALGATPDIDDNGVPDTCECLSDATGDGVVNVDDLVQVIIDWGQPGGVPGDVNHDDAVDVNDLVMVIAAWGVCG